VVAESVGKRGVVQIVVVGKGRRLLGEAEGDRHFVWKGSIRSWKKRG